MPLTATRELRDAFHPDHNPPHVGQARRWVRQTLRGWHLHAHADLAELVVSEMVTNALRRGAGPIGVALVYRRGALRVEVHDDGQGRPVRREVSDEDEGGRGLLLLDGLFGLHGGTRGVRDDQDGNGKTVYLEITLATSP